MGSSNSAASQTMDYDSDDISEDANSLNRSIRSTASTKNVGSPKSIKVQFRDKKKKLQISTITSIDELRKAAFGLFHSELTERNALLVYSNEDEKQQILDQITIINNKNIKIFVLTINPTCSSCQQPLGIRDDDAIYECPTESCGEQFCRLCIYFVQKHNDKAEFCCLSCQKIVKPKRNTLIDRYLVWPHFAATYAEDKLIDLWNKRETTSGEELLKDIRIRRAHIESRVQYIQNFNNQDQWDLETQATIQCANEFLDKMKSIAENVTQIENSIEENDASIYSIREKYLDAMANFHTKCESLLKHINSTNDKESIHDDSYNKERIKHIREKYQMDKLENLPNSTSVQDMNVILDDMDYRRTILEEYIKCGARIEISITPALRDSITCLRAVLQDVTKLKRAFNITRLGAQKIKDQRAEYIKLMTDDRFSYVCCSKFAIIMEELRCVADEFQRKLMFPKTIELIKIWQKDPGQYKEFKPKMPELFQVIETDLRQQMNENNLLTLPLRIGLIGKNSVGKTTIASLIGKFDHDKGLICYDRSTFNYLEKSVTIDHDDVQFPATLVDIEGSIDNEKYMQHGNYLQKIRVANCDIYLIVYEKQFEDRDKSCMEFVKGLGRKCFLVQNKADKLFLEVFEEVNRKPYDSQVVSRHIEKTIQRIKEKSKKSFDQLSINEEVYLIAGKPDERLINTNFIAFDQAKLLTKLVELSQSDCRTARIIDEGVSIANFAINTCFRRAFVVSSLKYRVGAAFASLLPFGDEAVSFWGREAIRQAFGIHENSTLYNKFTGRKHAFQEYLKGFKFSVPKKALKSSYFDYLIESENDLKTRTTDSLKRNNVKRSIEISETNKLHMIGEKIAHSNAITPLFTVAGGIVFSLDDILRIAVPAGAGALRVVSTVGIIVGAVAAPLFAAWGFYNTGKQLSGHLHKLCDDCFIVAICFIDNFCKNQDIFLQDEELNQASAIDHETVSVILNDS